MDNILDILGLKFEDLKPVEKETYFQMLKDLEKQTLTIEGLKDYIRFLLTAVETELAKDNLSEKQDLFLKARIKNLLLIDGFLHSPERAKKALQSYIHSLKK